MKNPLKPLDYFEFVKALKKRRKNILTGRFPLLKTGDFKISLQGGRQKRPVSDKWQQGTLAEYMDFEFNVIDKNGHVNIYLDERFKNMPYRDYYFSRDRQNEKVIIGYNHVFEILSYIEQMAFEKESYRNKKYYIKVMAQKGQFELVEALDSDIDEMLKSGDFNLLNLVLEKYPGVYREDASTYIVLRREYSFEGKYRYFALYPKEIEDIISLSIHYGMFEEKLKNELIKSWAKTFQSKHHLYSEDSRTWINQLEGEFFDCSANQRNLTNWIRKVKGMPLALCITDEGRVKEIYGDGQVLSTYFSALEQNRYDVLGALGEREYVVQNYNWNPISGGNNRYAGKGRFYGDVIIMCRVLGKEVSIEADDIKWLFDLGYLDESLKKHLRKRVYMEIFDEELRKRKNEEYLKSERDKTIEKARLAGLADGGCIVSLFNEEAGFRREELIDIYEVFPEEPRSTVASWVIKVERMLEDGYGLGCAVMYTTGSNQKNREEIKDKTLHFKQSNPGFSDDSYRKAINRGIRWSR